MGRHGGCVFNGTGIVSRRRSAVGVRIRIDGAMSPADGDNKKHLYVLTCICIYFIFVCTYVLTTLRTLLDAFWATFGRRPKVFQKFGPLLDHFWTTSVGTPPLIFYTSTGTPPLIFSTSVGSPPFIFYTSIGAPPLICYTVGTPPLIFYTSVRTPPPDFLIKPLSVRPP